MRAAWHGWAMSCGSHTGYAGRMTWHAGRIRYMRAAWHRSALHAGRMVQYAGRMVLMRVAWPLYAGRMTWQFFQRRSDLHAYRSNRSWQLSRLSCGSHITICGSHDVTESVSGWLSWSLGAQVRVCLFKGDQRLTNSVCIFLSSLPKLPSLSHVLRTIERQ